MKGHLKREANLRPYLGPSLRHDTESHILVVQTNPGRLSHKTEGRREL